MQKYFHLYVDGQPSMMSCFQEEILEAAHRAVSAGSTVEVRLTVVSDGDSTPSTTNNMVSYMLTDRRTKAFKAMRRR